jgi:N-acetylglucosamine-6-sulfatase
VAGARAGRSTDGVSLMPTIRHPRTRPDRAVQIEALAPLFEGNIPINGWDRPYSGVRTDRYTYVVYKETGDKELYDRRRDPYQLDNVAGDPAYARVEASLAARLSKLQGCRGRSCDVAGRVPRAR